MLPLIINSQKTRVADFFDELKKKEGIRNHNIVEIKPLKEEITIGQIRELKSDLLLSQKEKRMIVFHDFDRSGLETQNSLLKILEEKTDENLFVFLVKNPEKIIATIKSRTKLVEAKTKKTRVETDPFIEKLIGEIKKSKNTAFLNKKELAGIKKDSFLELAHKLLVYFRRPAEPTILKKILMISHLVEENNLNPVLAMDNLLIFIWKNYSMKLNS